MEKIEIAPVVNADEINADQFNGYVNNYKIVKTKKRSWLNVLILNVGVCLAVSLGLLIARLLGADEVIETFVKGMGA